MVVCSYRIATINNKFYCFGRVYLKKPVRITGTVATIIIYNICVLVSVDYYIRTKYLNVLVARKSAPLCG